MKKFFHELLRGNSYAPPAEVQNALYKNFHEPLSIEWFTREDHFEAIFYMGKREYLARFRPDGSMMDYKINLPAEALPEKIRRSAGSKGEIMNAVVIHEGEKVSYEIIYRNESLERFLTIINQEGIQSMAKPL
jgi:hypothetical protein